VPLANQNIKGGKGNTHCSRIRPYLIEIEVGSLESDCIMQMPIKNFLGRKLPPKLGMPLRHRFGGGREVEMSILKLLVAKTGTVIDVGANRGTYAWPLSRNLANDQELILIEPQANFVEYLCRAFRNNSLVTVIPRAASKRNGRVQINVELNDHDVKSGAVSMENYYSNSIPQEVETLAIDSLGINDCAFIKIDIDGHELDCLLGAHKTLLKSFPVLLIEIEFRMAEKKCLDTYQLLKGAGYAAYSFFDDKLNVVPEHFFNSPELNLHPDMSFRNNFVFLASNHWQILNRLS
jgi:FkbM family methyltransferase